MIWLIVIICLVICSIVAVTVYLLTTTASQVTKSRVSDHYAITDCSDSTSTECTIDTEEVIQDNEQSSITEKGLHGADSIVLGEHSITSGYIDWRDIAERKFRDNKRKQYAYLESSKLLGMMYADIIAGDMSDLKSLEDIFVQRGDTAYVKSEDSYYIRSVDDEWVKLEENNCDALLTELDFDLVMRKEYDSENQE